MPPGLARALPWEAHKQRPSESWGSETEVLCKRWSFLVRPFLHKRIMTVSVLSEEVDVSRSWVLCCWNGSGRINRTSLTQIRLVRNNAGVKSVRYYALTVSLHSHIGHRSSIYDFSPYGCTHLYRTEKTCCHGVEVNFYRVSPHHRSASHGRNHAIIPKRHGPVK